jgi:DNA modification methylase
MQIRDWLHVSDHCSAIDIVLHRGVNGEIYNIGGNNEKSNIEIIKLIIHMLGKTEKLIKYVQDRPGHDRRYAIDNTKITTQLGWKPAYTLKRGMKETTEWYLSNTAWMENIVSGDYANYYEKMYEVFELPSTSLRDKTPHPTTKPKELYKRLIQCSTNEGALILDPFAGSGTTLLACRETGRNCIAFEKDPKYEPIIRKRAMLDTKELTSFQTIETASPCDLLTFS